MIAALRCDLTHVATLQLSNTDSQTVLPGLTHNVHGAQHDGVEAERLQINRFFLRKLADLLRKLRDTEVAPGTSLLDETLVVMGSEMAHGSHWNDPLPLVVAGGGRYFRSGEHVKLAETLQHTRFLTTVLHALGFEDVERFGEHTDDAAGPLDSLRA